MEGSPSISNKPIVIVDAADRSNVLMQCVAPKPASAVLSALQMKLGAGLLYSTNGYTMLDKDELQAGEYTYDWQLAPAAAAAAAAAADVELVHVKVKGGGVTFSMDCPLFQHKLHVAAIEKTLAADKLMLVSINDCFPVTDDKGYTVEKFSGGSTVTVVAKLRPEDTYKDDDLKEKRKLRWTSAVVALITMLGTAIMTRLVMMVPLPRHK